jgi:hypothetical protein
MVMLAQTPSALGQRFRVPGVPLHNYFGWLLTTFLVYIGAGLLWRRKRGFVVEKGFPSLPILVYAFYGCSYTVPRRVPALQVVAFFAMILPGLLGLMQVWLPREPAEANADPSARDRRFAVVHGGISTHGVPRN